MNGANSKQSVWPFDIAVVGLGIVGTHQITREVEEVIRRCRRTFVIESGYGITDYLKTLCPDVTSLGSLYERGKSRLPTYRRMAAEVVSAALTKSPVCLAAYGHPWVYCYPTTLIKRAAPLLKLHVEVFPGISSFDTLLVDLGIDVAFDGIQMYEATDVLLRRRPIQNDVMCLIWQATIVGDPTYPDKPFEVQQYRPLQDYLLRFYPSSHEVTLVMTKTFPLLRSNIQRFRLDKLAVELQRAPQVGTLFIPPTRSRPIEDKELLNRMLAMSPLPPGQGKQTGPRRQGRPTIGPRPPQKK
jgi:precorrin-6B methylase 1